MGASIVPPMAPIPPNDVIDFGWIVIKKYALLLSHPASFALVTGQGERVEGWKGDKQTLLLHQQFAVATDDWLATPSSIASHSFPRPVPFFFPLLWESIIIFISISHPNTTPTPYSLPHPIYITLCKS